MPRFLLGLFVLLHGLVHIWYVVLSQRLVTFQDDMGWTGRSWLLTDVMADSPARLLASVLFGLSAIVFSLGGVGVFVAATWWRPVTLGAAVLSAIALILFWDGGWGMLVQKGALGLVIDLVLVAALLLTR